MAEVSVLESAQEQEPERALELEQVQAQEELVRELGAAWNLHQNLIYI